MPDPAPAAPSPKPADQLVPVGDRMEPLSKVVAGYQSLSAAEQKAVANAQRVQELEAQAAGLAQDAANFRQMKALVKSDPAAFLEQAQQIAGMPLGSQPGSAAADEAKIAMRQAHLEQQLRELQGTIQTKDTREQISAAMGQYALLQNSPEPLRQYVRDSVEAALKADPKASPADLVSRAHTALLPLSQAQTAQTVAARQQVAATLGAPPAASGTPSLTNPEPAPTYKDWKGGGGKAHFQAFMQRALAGPRDTTG